MSNERFDKFTERARRVLTLAQEEATRFNHNYVGTEHLLLGLLREHDSVAAQVLRSLGAEPVRIRRALEFIIGRGDRMIVGEVGLTPRATKVIELAVDEARRLGHHYIGTEHLLLGLVREGEGIAASVLESLGVNLEKARAETLKVLKQRQAGGGAAEQETQSPSESAAQEAQHLLESVPGVDDNPTLSLHDTWAAIVAVDEDCRICALNREAERITGLQAHEVLGRRFCEALWPLGCGASPEYSGCPWQHAIRGHERRKHPREVMARIGERRIDVLVGARTTLTEHGRPGALITFVDLSQRREMERVRNELVADVFHELRSPICAISMAAHFLNADFDRLGMQSVPAFPQGRRVHWDYLVADVEYPQWDDPDAGAERRQRDVGSVIKRFLGTEEAPAGLHGKPVAEVLGILGAEGWELAAIDHSAAAGGSSGHFYVFKRLLLNRSTVTVDAPTVTRMPLQLDPIVDQVIWKLEPLLAERGQRARKAYSVVPDVLADERRIEQVLVNLLTNANKYSVDGDELLVDAVVRGDALLVSVEDHGRGIDPQDRAHIFDRFYRAGTTAELTTGAGLGLAIVRTIIEAHKGHVGVDDVRPHGARFWFSLPLA